MILTPQSVLTYIKLNLGFPYKSLEHTDDTILNYITTYTLLKFSEEFPQEAYLAIGEQDKGPNTLNEYLLKDPDDRQILSVVDVFIPREHVWLFGYSWDLMPSLESVYIDTLTNTEASLKQSVSLLKKSWTFIPPNRLIVVPAIFQTPLLVKYHRTHAKDFSSIPPLHAHTFLQMCLADVLDWFASVREQYQSVETPFGTITLNPEALRERAREIREELREIISTLPPNTIVAVA